MSNKGKKLFYWCKNHKWELKFCNGSIAWCYSEKNYNKPCKYALINQNKCPYFEKSCNKKYC